MLSENLKLHVRNEHFKTSLIHPMAWKPFNPPGGRTGIASHAEWDKFLENN
jgi:hypothetical protein